MSETPTTGPIEWAALTFPGPSLDARVVPPIKELVDTSTVRLLDAVVLHKSADGVMRESELEDEGVKAFDTLDGDVLELFSDDDLIAIAAGLAPDSTTLVLVWENRWAAGFAAAVRRAGGVLSAHDRVSVDLADAAMRRSHLAGASA